jgi:hypothetical protein
MARVGPIYNCDCPKTISAAIVRKQLMPLLKLKRAIKKRLRARRTGLAHKAPFLIFQKQIIPVSVRVGAENPLEISRKVSTITKIFQVLMDQLSQKDTREKSKKRFIFKI